MAGIFQTPLLDSRPSSQFVGRTEQTPFVPELRSLS